MTEVCVDARVDVDVRVLSGWKEEKGEKGRLDRVRWKGEEEEWWTDGGRMDEWRGMGGTGGMGGWRI